jgi:hypothetical protein
MEYNSQREKLIIPEYGRIVQDMVSQCLATEDRDKRSRLAKVIVHVMAQLNPQIRDYNDYKQKLWDHLHIISDFKLDVDSPYPVPTRDIINHKPEPIPYKSATVAYRHYGRNIQEIIRKAIEMEDGEEKTALIRAIGNYLKKSYLAWNRDSVTDEVIAQNLHEMSKGKLSIGADITLEHNPELPVQPRPVARKRNKRSNRNHQNPRGGQWTKRY